MTFQPLRPDPRPLTRTRLTLAASTLLALADELERGGVARGIVLGLRWAAQLVKVARGEK